MVKPVPLKADRAWNRDKLERYADYRRSVSTSGEQAAQADVDRALGLLRGSQGATLPKGLSAGTADAVADALRQADAPLSASDLAEALGISRVTARRYLEHLVDIGNAQRAPRYGGTGRPEHLYAWRRRHDARCDVRPTTARAGLHRRTP